MNVIAVKVVQMHDVGIHGGNMLDQLSRCALRIIPLLAKQTAKERVAFPIELVSNAIPVFGGVDAGLICVKGLIAVFRQHIADVLYDKSRAGISVRRIDLQYFHLAILKATVLWIHEQFSVLFLFCGFQARFHKPALHTPKAHLDRLKRLGILRPFPLACSR